jgi:serine/threonine protein kinase
MISRPSPHDRWLMNDSTREETAVFKAAMELATAAEREVYVAKTCAGDERLRQKVMALLRAHQHPGEVFQAVPAGGHVAPPTAATPGPGGTLILPPSEKAGDRIGRYKLLQQIGEGGCGVVYMAEQEEPVRRRVALKIIKLGMDTKSVIARFEAERQALAMMEHSHIAKVLDAGATTTGRPYFVMELIRGSPITEYCDQHHLATPARLELFVQVCQAIQHAHQKGVIHRDIKPSNILVTVNDGVAVPKVIDFGIAKATAQQRLTDKTLFTEFQQFIGTPAYMSPEQAVMTSLDIDTRTDIYSLGVLLYELLTGSTPFEPTTLLGAGLDEMRRIIREEEPPRPSARLSTLAMTDAAALARQRRERLPVLVSLVRGDLDWIVMKCLEKDRTRRYETASGLAMDVQRHLENEAVEACPPSNLYRLQKFVRRHRLAVSASAAIVTSLLLGLGLAAWSFARERDAYRETERALRAAEAARQQLLIQKRERAIENVLLAEKIGDTETMLTAIEEATRQGASPAQVRMLLGRQAVASGDAAKGLKQLKEAVALEPRNIPAQALLALACMDSGLHQEFQDHLAALDRLAPAIWEDFLYKGLVVAMDFNPQRGLPLLDKAVGLRPDSPMARVFRADARLSVAQDTGRLTEALAALEDITAATNWVKDNPYVLGTAANCHLTAAHAYGEIGRSVERSLHLAEAEAISRRLTAFGTNRVAVGLRFVHLSEMGREGEALALLQGWFQEPRLAGATTNLAAAAEPSSSADPPEPRLLAGVPPMRAGMGDNLRAGRDPPDPTLARAYALALFRRGEAAQAVAVLSSCHDGSPATEMMRILMLPELRDGPARAESAYRTFTQIRRGPLGKLSRPLLLLYLGKKEAAMTAARDLRASPPAGFELLRSPQQRTARFFAGEISEADYLEAAAGSRIELCKGHLNAAWMHLAEGDRDGARDHFQKSAGTGAFLYGTHESKACLARLEKDPNWPAWIPRRP